MTKCILWQRKSFSGATEETEQVKTRFGFTLAEVLITLGLLHRAQVTVLQIILNQANQFVHF